MRQAVVLLRDGRPVAPVTVLSVSEEGRTRLRAIPQGQIVTLRDLTARYQRFRQARARLVKVHAQMLAVLDQLEAARRKAP